MKATTQLQVKPDMRVSVTLEMTVEEMDATLKATANVDVWPVWQLRKVLRESLGMARAAYSSEHEIDPTR